jgi:hypothetical protein
MTVDEYRAIARRLCPHGSNVPGVRRSASGEFHNVPDPLRYTSEQRLEIIERLKAAVMGPLSIEDVDRGYSGR